MENENNRFLVFGNSGSLFAVTAQAVREIFALPEITPLEESPPCVVGVINLRGEIVPVMDLESTFRPCAREISSFGLRYRSGPECLEMLVIDQLTTASTRTGNSATLHRNRLYGALAW